MEQERLGGEEGRRMLEGRGSCRHIHTAYCTAGEDLQRKLGEGGGAEGGGHVLGGGQVY